MTPIPLKDGTEYLPEEKYIEELKLAYQGLDIDQQLRQMRIWCISNPSRRKTKRGIKKFINGWLNRNEKDHKLQARHGVSKATRAGNAIFGTGTEDDHLDMGETGSQLRTIVHESDY
jgi:hypothetical protein